MKKSKSQVSCRNLWMTPNLTSKMMSIIAYQPKRVNLFFFLILIDF